MLSINNDDLKLLIEKIVGSLSFNDKIFYHGRKDGRRPYRGNYIYISDSFEYAAGYSDGKIVYEFKIPFPESKIFTLKNRKNVELLKTITDKQGFENIIKNAGSGGEMDWTSLNYIYNDEFDGEEVLESLGFYGVKLNERPGIESILIFDQSKLQQVGTVDLTKQGNTDKVSKFNSDFQNKYKHL